jgi:hypothetical protein
MLVAIADLKLIMNPVRTHASLCSAAVGIAHVLRCCDADAACEHHLLGPHPMHLCCVLALHCCTAQVARVYGRAVHEMLLVWLYSQSEEWATWREAWHRDKEARAVAAEARADR